MLTEEEIRFALAKIKALEAETELLRDTFNEAEHWKRPEEFRDALKRIHDMTKQIAGRLNLGDLDG